MNENNLSNKIDRFDEIREGLEYLIDKPNVSIYELMNEKFIQNNTDFDTLGNFLNAAGVKSKEDFTNPNFTSFLKTHSRFNDWEEMLIQAGNQYAEHHLND